MAERHRPRSRRWLARAPSAPAARRWSSPTLPRRGRAGSSRRSASSTSTPSRPSPAARRRRELVRARTTDAARGRRSSCRWPQAAERHPELVERHLGSIVAADDPFVARNDAEWTGGPFVYVPRGVTRRGADRRSRPSTAAGTALHWRTLDRARGGRRRPRSGTQYLLRPRRRGLLNTRRRARRRPERDAALRRRPGPRGETWIFGAQRAEVERDGTLDWVALGFGSAQRQGACMETKLAGQGADAQGHRRLRGARAPAPRLRHDAGARGARHDVRPRLPRDPRRPLDARCGAG